MAELNLIFLGPPGAGKGTQAQRLGTDFRLPYISTGDMLREAVRTSTELGLQAKDFMDEGQLVPDELIIDMTMERLSHGDAEDGFILDGFPRRVEQADALAEAMNKADRRLSGAILIDVSDEEVVRRISGRRVCVKGGHNYHVDFDPPKREGVCDQDGSRLIQRDDDKPEVVKRRLHVYHEQTAPLESYYDERGLLRRVDGERSPTEVHDHIRAIVATLKLEEDL